MIDNINISCVDHVPVLKSLLMTMKMPGKTVILKQHFHSP